ncbi:tRNA(Ile)-lysidine synthase [Yoonia maricola]|uniref:tRNA(Ile)-lysidine synthase n=1 Tax=Yoonia maricola TaxID=420999 RepID=A0A2M8WPE2_9RHOB|nr:tRNA lysidine(34) synthetase TilS [Yoonia maricola]PJI92788.1 tRNA(Ile)-lysidine synthase [Yoonia maricola]
MPVKAAAADIVDRFQAALTDHSPSANVRIGLAVSGGGDSVALMHLAARHLDPKQLYVLTVDHGLRSEAKTEIAEVSKQAGDLGLHHTIAEWGWDGKGNLQAAARAGRWGAIYDWAMMQNIRTVWMGHTEDDQIETVLMRLARGSGIDGLRAMYPLTTRDGLQILRPLLGCARDDLRAWLTDHDITWCDDPSNDDPRFERVRTRQMFAQLQALGLTRKRLLQTIDHMQAAHTSLQMAAYEFARQHVRQDAGDLLFAPEALDLGKADAPRRVMAAAFAWVGNRTYRPRFEQLLETVAQARKGATVTLGGCIMAPCDGGVVRLLREAAATTATRHDAAKADAKGVFWDQRWYLEGPLADELTYKALGDGIKDCPHWRQSGMPRASLLASPAVWRGGALIAAPLAGLSNGWSARIVADFHSTAFAIED